MKEVINKHYKYRKWPFFLFVYILFSIFYFFFVYSLEELSYRAIIETAVMTIFIVTAPALAYFDFKIVKIKIYKTLGLELLYTWMISTVSIFILMLTYLEGWEWFGAIALLFFLFCYNIFCFICFYIYFRIKKRKLNK